MHSHALTEAIAFVVKEPEGLILLDRPSGLRPKLVLLKLGLLYACFVIEEIVGVENVVAEEFPRTAVNRIRSRLRGDVDVGAGSRTEFSGSDVGLDLEFRNRINRRAERHRL